MPDPRQIRILHLMFVPPDLFNANFSARQMVKNNYRAARVFLKYEIPFCCGASFPLKDVCESRGIEPEILLAEILKETREFRLPGAPGFEEWPTSFLIDYVINVHHRYLQNILPELAVLIKDFVEEHQKLYPVLIPLTGQFAQLSKDLTALAQMEEEIIFPYIRQITHAYQNRDSYGKLLVKTLRKPVTMIRNQQLRIEFLLRELNERTNNFTPPEKACINHQVIFARLKELDMDLDQHGHLEKGLLYPRLAQLEAELGYKDPQ